MLSNDLFSYLDSDEHPSPSGSPLFPEADPWQENNSEANLFDPQLLECISIVNAAETEQRAPLSDRSEKKVGKIKQKVIEINMGSDQEDELVKYLTGDYEEKAPPCLKLVRRANENRSPATSVEDDRDNYGLCMSKNAIAARETRQRKKEYVENLEYSVEKLRTENKNLKTESNKLKTSVKELNQEVYYLKSVLANQSALAGLLQNIQNTPGVRFQSSLMLSPNQHEANSKPRKPTATVAGTLKTKPLKRKMCEENISVNITDLEKPKVNKRVCHDHHYAAEPRALDSNVNKEDHCVNKSEEFGMSQIEDMDMLPSENSSIAFGGVCLHVSDGSVSLEFCALCSENASNAQREILLRSENINE